VNQASGTTTVSCTDGSSAAWFTGFPPALDAGSLHNCGLMRNRSVVCWGSNGNTQVSPVPAGSYTQVSAGFDHTCGLTSEGAALCWGSNSVGQSSPLPFFP
jgi:alpha-tubulin suppressor-like RCC1 family protein